MKQRSLLCAMEGYVTVQIVFRISIQRLGFAWSFLRKHFDEKLVDSVKGMKKINNMDGVLFDVAEEYK